MFCISVTVRIWEMVRDTFLVTKWCRFRISKPFSNRSKFLSIQFWSLGDPVSENRVRFERSIKNIFTFVKNLSKNDICYINFEIFFSKKNFWLRIVQFVKITFFFRFAKIFQFFVVAPPISNFLKFLKKWNISMTMKSWTLVMDCFFSVSDPLSEKLTIF